MMGKSTMLQIKVLCLATLVIATSTSIHIVCAEEAVVDIGGSGKYTSIQAAIDGSSNGSTVIVLPGVYNENLFINKTLTIVSKTGDPIDVKIIAPRPDAIAVEIDANNTVFDGFTVTSYYSLGQDYGIFIRESENVTIKSNMFLGCDEGISVVKSHNCTIEDNYIEGQKGGKGIDLYLSGNNLIQRNTIVKSGGAIWEDYCNIGNVYCENNLSNNWNGITLSHDSDNSLVCNNLIQGNKNDGISISWADNNVIINNFVLENGQGINIYDSKYNNISNNVVMDNQYGIEFASAYYNLIYNNYFRNPKNIAWGDGFNVWNVSKTPGENIIGGPYIAGNCWLDDAGNGISHELPDFNNDGICDEEYDIEYDGRDFLPLKDNGKIPLRNQLDTKQTPINFIFVISIFLLSALLKNMIMKRSN